MGSYSVLTVGRAVLQWKYRIPSFLSFLFDEQDFYSDLPDELDDYTEGERGVGFTTTAAAARRRLDDHGFTLQFFAATYRLLDDEIDDWVTHVIGEALAEERSYPADQRLIDDLTRRHIRSFRRGTPLDDIHKFVRLLRALLDDDDRPGVSELASACVQLNGDRIAIDLADLSYHVDRSACQLDPGVLRIGQLLSESSLEDYPEVASLLFLRLLLEATRPEAEVHLDLRDLWEGQDFSNQPAEMAEELSRKVRVYNHVFAVLSDNEADIRARATRSRIKSILDRLPRADNNDSKGRLLEDLVAAIFESHPGFVIAQRRYDLGDQEIDLVIRNHLEDGFWRGLDSPLILVECKNWSEPVGADQIRDFEGKLRDHQPHARLGFFVAPGGFTKYVETALIAARREPYQIVPIGMTHIDDLVESRKDVVDWLAARISALG